MLDGLLLLGLSGSDRSWCQILGQLGSLGTTSISAYLWVGVAAAAEAALILRVGFIPDMPPALSELLLGLHVNKKQEKEEKQQPQNARIPHPLIFSCNRGNGPALSTRAGGLARQLTSLQRDPKTFDVTSVSSPSYL